MAFKTSYKTYESVVRCSKNDAKRTVSFSYAILQNYHDSIMVQSSKVGKIVVRYSILHFEKCEMAFKAVYIIEH